MKILFDEGASDDEGASEDDDDYYYDVVVVVGGGGGDGMLMLMLMNLRSIRFLHGRACHIWQSNMACWQIPPSTLMIFETRNLHLDSLHQFSH